MRSHEYFKSSLGLGSYGSYWRTLRRICASELSTKMKITETMLIRRKCVDDMLLWIEREAKICGSSGIEVKQFVFPALYNTMGNIILSKDLVDPQSRMASEFYSAMKEFLECLGHRNISYLFPSLRWLDLQGLRRRTDHVLGKTLKITSGFVKERVEQQHQNEERSLDTGKDFLDVLLDFRGTGKDEPAKLSESQISIFLVDMFIAGIDTTSTSVEWAMSELLNKPDVMIKIKAEL